MHVEQTYLYIHAPTKHLDCRGITHCWELQLVRVLLHSFPACLQVSHRRSTWSDPAGSSYVYLLNAFLSHFSPKLGLVEPMGMWV